MASTRCWVMSPTTISIWLNRIGRLQTRFAIRLVPLERQHGGNPINHHDRERQQNDREAKGVGDRKPDRGQPEPDEEKPGGPDHKWDLPHPARADDNPA